MNDIFVYLVDLPAGVDEMVLTCLSGYTIYINARLSKMGAIRAYQHALKHIDNGDFEKFNVQHI